MLKNYVDTSHTEINNIESSNCIKLAILTIKAFEKYLDSDFKKTTKLVRYSDENIEYANDSIIVSYKKFDKIKSCICKAFLLPIFKETTNYFKI